jgi:hypothetical protein
MVVLGVILSLLGSAQADPIRLGFDSNTLARNDDGSTGLEPIGFQVNFFGTNYTQLYVNNNGNVTFDVPLGTFTPFDLLTTSTVIIAPFFADVDTRSWGDPVTYGSGMVGGRDAFGVNWLNADYYSSSSSHGDQLNDFQLVLVERFDTGPGNFDIEFNYEQLLWETGDASGGVGGLGGASARAGYSNGTDTAFEIAGSAVNGAFLDGGPMSLVQGSNVGIPGRFLFEVREGEVQPPLPTIPEPSTVFLLGLGLVGIACYRKRKR